MPSSAFHTNQWIPWEYQVTRDGPHACFPRSNALLQLLIDKTQRSTAFCRFRHVILLQQRMIGRRCRLAEFVMAATFAKPYSTKISGFFLIWSPGMQFSVWTQFVCGGRSPCKLVAFTKIWVQILSNYDGNLTYHKMLLPFSFGRQSEVLRLLHSQLIWKENVLPARSLDSTVSSFVLLLSTTWSRETSHQLFDSYILAWNSSTWSSQATRCFAYLGSQMESSTISVDLVATCKTEAHHRSKCIICSIINDVDGMNPPILKCTNVLIGSQCATSYYCYGDLYQKQSNLRPFFSRNYLRHIMVEVFLSIQWPLGPRHPMGLYISWAEDHRQARCLQGHQTQGLPYWQLSQEEPGATLAVDFLHLRCPPS